MAFFNIARHGYQHTVAGAWDLGGGERLVFFIDDPHAKRCTIEIQARGDLLTDPARSRTQSVAAALVATAVEVESTIDLAGPYMRIQHQAFGLGGPMARGADPFVERRRSTFREAMEARAGKGKESLAWIADTCLESIGERPYFVDDEGPWWEAGVFVVPLLPAGARGDGAPGRIAILRVRTDVPGTLLGVEAVSLADGRRVVTASGVFDRADADLPAEVEMAARL